MHLGKKILFYANILSLDVVAGALAGMVFFSDLLDIEVSGIAFTVLALAVWSIYTFDHLWDARTSKGIPQSKRHFFHYRYFRPLGFAFILSVCLLGVLLLVEEEVKALLLPGFALGLGLFIWSGLVKLSGRAGAFFKEVLTALFYVAGIALVPVVVFGWKHLPLLFFVYAGLYFLIAWANLLILSLLDKDLDREEFGSVLNIISEADLVRLIKIILLLTALALLTLLFFQKSFFHLHASILGLMLWVHGRNFLGGNRDVQVKRQEMEASFLLPFLLLLFH